MSKTFILLTDSTGPVFPALSFVVGESCRGTINPEIHEFDRYITIMTLQRKDSTSSSANTMRAICEGPEDCIRGRYPSGDLD